MGRTAAKRDPKALIHEVFTREAAHMSLDKAVADFPSVRSTPSLPIFRTVSGTSSNTSGSVSALPRCMRRCLAC